MAVNKYTETRLVSSITDLRVFLIIRIVFKYSVDEIPRVALLGFTIIVKAFELPVACDIIGSLLISSLFLTTLCCQIFRRQQLELPVRFDGVQQMPAPVPKERTARFPHQPEPPAGASEHPMQPQPQHPDQAGHTTSGPASSQPEVCALFWFSSIQAVQGTLSLSPASCHTTSSPDTCDPT